MQRKPGCCTTAPWRTRLATATHRIRISQPRTTTAKSIRDAYHAQNHDYVYACFVSNREDAIIKKQRGTLNVRKGRFNQKRYHVFISFLSEAMSQSYMQSVLFQVFRDPHYLEHKWRSPIREAFVIGVI
jgi:hypothetical protein